MRYNIKIEDHLEFLKTPNTHFKRIWKRLCI